MLPESDIAGLVKDELLPMWEKERERLDLIDRWYRWEQEPIQVPRSATPELKQMAQLSRVPWLSLVVTTVAQAMYVDGYRSRLDPAVDREPGKLSGPWETWLRNDMDQRQIAIHRATLAYGYSFASVLPGEDHRGKPIAAIRGISPRKMVAVYEDPAADDWPLYAMHCERRGEDRHEVALYDDEVIHRLLLSDHGDKVEYLGYEIHAVGWVPIVRYVNELDLDGRTPGEIEPHIPLAARINKTAYDRMLVQHFGSWKVRTIAGLAEPESDETAHRQKLRLRQDDLLVAEDPDTKFGTLDETPLDGFISAHRADIESLAAVTQTPTHELTGQLANLSAEALAAARAALGQKVTERQKSIGKSHGQVLRLSAFIDGDDDHADDFTGRVTWQDMEIRSMAQAVDALGKAAQMLGVPVQALWGRIPGVEKSDVDEWAELAKDGDPIRQMQLEMEARIKKEYAPDPPPVAAPPANAAPPAKAPAKAPAKPAKGA